MSLIPGPCHSSRTITFYLFVRGPKVFLSQFIFYMLIVTFLHEFILMVADASYSRIVHLLVHYIPDY